MSVKWAKLLPVVGGVVDLILLRIVGVPAVMTSPPLHNFFLGLNAPVVILRLLPPIFDSPTGIFLGCLAHDLNIVVGSLVLWFFLGRGIDGDHRWPQGRVFSIALGVFLLCIGGMLAFMGIEGSQEGGEGKIGLPWYLWMMILVWAAGFFYAAWRQFLDLHQRPSGGLKVA